MIFFQYYCNAHQGKTFKIDTNGDFEVYYVDDATNKTLKQTYGRDEHCLGVEDVPDYESTTGETGNNSEEGSNLEPVHFICKYPTQNEQEEFKSKFYPTALLISAFFVLITFIVYVILDDLHAQLFGKITIGFQLSR